MVDALQGLLSASAASTFLVRGVAVLAVLFLRLLAASYVLSALLSAFRPLKREVRGHNTVFTDLAERAWWRQRALRGQAPDTASLMTLLEHAMRQRESDTTYDTSQHQPLQRAVSRRTAASLFAVSMRRMSSRSLVWPAPMMDTPRVSTARVSATDVVMTSNSGLYQHTPQLAQRASISRRSSGMNQQPPQLTLSPSLSRLAWTQSSLPDISVNHESVTPRRQTEVSMPAPRERSIVRSKTCQDLSSGLSTTQSSSELGQAPALPLSGLLRTVLTSSLSLRRVSRASLSRVTPSDRPSADGATEGASTGDTVPRQSGDGLQLYLPQRSGRGPALLRPNLRISESGFGDARRERGVKPRVSLAGFVIEVRGWETQCVAEYLFTVSSTHTLLDRSSGTCMSVFCACVCACVCSTEQTGLHASP